MNTSADPLSVFSTYLQDLAIFRRLGLAIFKDLPCGTEHRVGEVQTCCDLATVSIFVTGMPAQFWRFEISDWQQNRLVIRTGSGSLVRFWHAIELMAAGLLKLDMSPAVPIDRALLTIATDVLARLEAHTACGVVYGRDGRWTDFRDVKRMLRRLIEEAQGSVTDGVAENTLGVGAGHEAPLVRLGPGGDFTLDIHG